MALIPQTFGRSFFGIFVLPLSPTQAGPFVFLCLLMFCLVESFRYGFYFLKQQGLDETLIGRIFGLIRYNSFLVCYPLGAIGECMSLYLLAKSLGRDIPDAYSIKMPNRFNFAFNVPYFMYLMLPTYAVVFPRIYTYLLKQRRQYLASTQKKKRTE